MAKIAKMVSDFPAKGDVLEVGGMNVNGTVRPIFGQSERFTSYISTDMRPGKGVDQVMNSHSLSFPDETFNTIICCEMLEHDDQPWNSIKEMYRVLKHDGWILLSTPDFGFHQHGYPNDYYRFSEEGLGALLEYGGFEVKLKEKGSYAVGYKV
jgi:SAM-dependent methyltransferase